MTVANSSPLVYLAALSDFSLLQQLFGALAIPPAVYREVVTEGAGYPVGAAVSAALDQWLHVLQLTKPAPRLGPEIHAGEAEAIGLALGISADAVLIDDRAAVRQARKLGLLAVPTPSIYIRAKRRGLIPSVREKLNQLRQAGFWLKEADYDTVLREAEEP